MQNNDTSPVDMLDDPLGELEQLAHSPQPLDFICNHKWAELGQRLYRVDQLRFQELVAKFEAYVCTVEDQVTTAAELRKCLEPRSRS